MVIDIASETVANRVVETVMEIGLKVKQTSIFVLEIHLELKLGDSVHLVCTLFIFFRQGI